MNLRESKHLLQCEETGAFMWRSIFYLKDRTILGAVNVGFDRSGLLYAPDTMIFGDIITVLEGPNSKGAMVYREA